jgi:hypothetical protein
MSKDLLIRLNVPVPTQAIAPHPGLIFNRWLPIKEGDALLFSEDAFELTIWFDMTCIDEGFRGLFTEDELYKWANVTVSNVFMDVTAKDIPDDLADFIFATADRRDISKAELNDNFQELNARIIKLAIKYLNRITAYFRNEKGQYWLEDYRYLYDTYLLNARNKTPFHIAFKATVKAEVGEPEWVKWNPPYTDVLMVPGGPESVYVKREEWSEVYDFVSTSRRPTLILELLASSENLANNGYRRSAIIEAVTALEIAINSFSKSPRWDAITSPNTARRIDTGSFASQVDHLGFSGTLRYLIPLLFSESILPSDLLNKCQDAVAIRHDVVHRGQRKIDKLKLLSMVNAIRQTCSILKQFTE